MKQTGLGAPFTVGPIAAGELPSHNHSVTQVADAASLSAANTFLTGPQAVQTGGVATPGLLVRGASGQTASLQEWQEATGIRLSTIDSSGAFRGGLGVVLQNASFQGAVFATTALASYTVYDGLLIMNTNSTTSGSIDVKSRPGGGGTNLSGLDRVGAFLSVRVRWVNPMQPAHELYVVAGGGGTTNQAPMDGIGFRVQGGNLEGITISGWLHSAVTLSPVTQGDRMDLLAVRMPDRVRFFASFNANPAIFGDSLINLPSAAMNVYEVQLRNTTSPTFCVSEVSMLTVGIPIR